MKKIIVILSILSLFFGFIFETYALDSPGNLKVDESTDNSVKLSWDKVDKAFMYSVYYSKVPGAEKAYDNQTDYLETNNTEIKNLGSGTYYFSVVALNDLGEESAFGKELSFSINGSKEGEFILKTINVLSLNGIELVFSAPLENTKDSIRTFKIVNKEDKTETYSVIKTEVNPDDNSKVLLTLDKDTIVGKEYEVTVTAIKSLSGKNLQSGIDSTEVFMVKDLSNENVEKTNIALPTNTDTSNNSELNSNNQTTEVSNGTGVELLAASELPEELPVTGTQHVVLLFLSMIIGLGFFVFKIKKS